MDLKGNKILISELMADPRAAAVIRKRSFKRIDDQTLRAAGSLTLEQVLRLVKHHVPKTLLHETLEELKKL